MQSRQAGRLQGKMEQAGSYRRTQQQMMRRYCPTTCLLAQYGQFNGAVPHRLAPPRLSALQHSKQSVSFVPLGSADSMHCNHRARGACIYSARRNSTGRTTFCAAVARTARRLGAGRFWHVGDTVQSNAGLETVCMTETLANEERKVCNYQGGLYT